MTSYDFICPKYHNPADFIMEVASGEFGEESTRQMISATSLKTANKFVMNQNKKLMPMHSDSDRELREHKCYTASLWKQFGILLKRQFLTTYRKDSKCKILKIPKFIQLFYTQILF